AVELATYLAKNDVAVACLQENKLSAASRPPSFPGYALERKDRPRGHGGGLLTLIRHVSFTGQDISPLLHGDTTMEAMAISIPLNGSPLRIINVYIPPASSCPAGYSPELSDIVSLPGDCLIVGDFNAHHPSWFSHTDDQRAAARGAAVDDVVANSSLAFLNEDSYTRRPSHGPPSSPDLAIISDHLLLDTSWTPQVALNSDHLPILIHLPSSVDSSTPRAARFYVNFKKADWPAYTAATEAALQMVNNAEHSRQHIPAGFRKDFSPSVNPGTRLLIEQRDDTRARDPSDPRLPNLNLEISISIQAHARDKWRTHLASCCRRTNQSKHWNLLRSLAGKRNRPPPNQPIQFGLNTLSSQRKISSAFCKLFTSLAPHSQSPSTRRLICRIQAEHPLDRDFSPFTPDMVKLAIAAAKNSSARGPDGLT
ncbi:uncharacterized protein LOC108681219, partial [Hyalella azteca]|uniref:Uncharacterized protein LOC108681219 n=1 Tax=Hyalella azteca TaxID=294128 RepID=A0A8B7PHS8_HYAAZ